MDLVNGEKLLQFGALKAEKLALGREGHVNCHNVWDWLVAEIAKELRLQHSAILPRVTFGELGANDQQVESFLSIVGESYQIRSIAIEFANFLRKKYSLREIGAWNYVPVGDLADFVHKNHGLERSHNDPDCR